MREEEIRNLNIMAKATNYNRWLFNNIKPYLGKRILEVGSGIGNITELLIENRDTKLLVGIDNYSEFLDIIDRRFGRYKKFQSFECDISSEKSLSLKRYNFDTIVCINVLEHIKDDIKALENMYNLGETLILFVPSLQKLYGTVDKIAGHFIRYNKEDLEVKLLQSGWKICKCSYMNLLGIIVWFLHGKILRKSIHPPRQVSFLDKFIFLEILIEKIVNLPVGLSLLCICRRKEETRIP